MILSSGLNDCGVCALANALGISWKDSKNLIWPKGRRGQNYYTTTKQLIEALRKYGIKIKQNKLESNHEREWPQTISIVKVRPRGCKKHNWHWVTCDGTYVYDNHYNKPKLIERYELNPMGYINIGENI